LRWVFYSDDIQEAMDVIFGVLGQIKGIQTDPAPDVATVDLAASWVTLKVRWWVDTERDTAYTVTAEVC
jgi:small conductance mechanosensitive channel